MNSSFTAGSERFRTSSSVAKSTLGVIAAILIASSMWFYVNHILVAYQISDAAAHGRPRGNLCDLYPRWLGARELLLHGRDPYGEDITREIQLGYYGRVLDPSRPNDPKDQQGFAYPVYVVFLLAPTVHLPFLAVQKGFNDLLWFLTAASVLLWLRVVGWAPPSGAKAMLVILTLGSVPAVQALKLEQLSLVVAVLLAAGAAAIVGGRLVLSGVLFAVATIKPQLAWLPILWMLGWSLHRWRSRQRVVWAFGIAMLALLAGAEIVLPGWIGEFRTAIANYHQYTHNMSVLSWMTTPLIGDAMALLLIAGVAVYCWRIVGSDPSSPNFAIALSLVMALTVLVVPMFAPYNQVLLLPAVLLLLRHVPELWRRGGTARILLIICGGFLFWPWLVTLALTAASAFLAPATVQRAWSSPLYASLGVPLAVFALLSFYTVRFAHGEGFAKSERTSQ